MVMTSSGVKVSVSVGEPTTFDLAGYSSKSYLEIGELTTIPSFGANAALVTHSPLATGVVKKHKGFVDYGETTIEAAMDNDDLGQQIIIALNEGNIKDSDCTIRLDYPDEASRYLQARYSPSMRLWAVQITS